MRWTTEPSLITTYGRFYMSIFRQDDISTPKPCLPTCGYLPTYSPIYIYPSTHLPIYPSTHLPIYLSLSPHHFSVPAGTWDDVPQYFGWGDVGRTGEPECVTLVQPDADAGGSAVGLPPGFCAEHAMPVPDVPSFQVHLANGPWQALKHSHTISIHILQVSECVFIWRTFY